MKTGKQLTKEINFYNLSMSGILKSLGWFVDSGAVLAVRVSISDKYAFTLYLRVVVIIQDRIAGLI
jgi:hypothetical protein